MLLINIDVIYVPTQYTRSVGVVLTTHKSIIRRVTLLEKTLQYEYCSRISEYSSTNQFPLVRVERSLSHNDVIVYFHSMGNLVVIVVTIDTTTAATLSEVDVAVKDHGAG